MKHKKLLLVVMIGIGLTACQQPSYRGVPASQWKQLNSEQKSLLIDQAYDNDINAAGTPPTAGSVTAQTPIGSLTTQSVDSSEAVIPMLHATYQMQAKAMSEATLVWQMGTIDAGINNQANPFLDGEAGQSYNKAQQTVFMTSLKDELTQQQTFKNIDLVPTAPKAAAMPIITIYFKSTYVSDRTEGSQVTLDTVLRIEAPNQPIFTKTYLVTSDQSGSFKTKMQTVSTSLLDKVLKGIDDWAKTTQH
jgi:hypothetical protein